MPRRILPLSIAAWFRFRKWPDDMDQFDPPWSVPVTVAEIPDGGSHYNLIADASMRDAVMKLAPIRTLSRLEASFDLTRRGEAVAVRGEVTAQVGQT